jgi:hypothetical protein
MGHRNIGIEDIEGVLGLIGMVSRLHLDGMVSRTTNLCSTSLLR